MKDTFVGWYVSKWRW